MKKTIALYASAASMLAAPACSAVLENATVRAETVAIKAGPDPNAVTVRLSVRQGNQWRPVLQSVASPSGTLDTLLLPPSGDGRRLRLAGRNITTDVTLGTKPGHVRVVSRVRLDSPRDVEGVSGRWRFLGGNPDAVWTPNLTPGPNQVIGQHAFRSPAVVVQREGLAAVLLPDVDTLAMNPDSLPATLSLDVRGAGGAMLGMALQPHQVERHVYWRHEPGQTVRVGSGTITLAYDILLTGKAEPRRAYRLASRWWWEKEGTKTLRADTMPQAVPWAVYARTGIDEYWLPHIWRETKMGGETVGGAAMPVLASRNATWFQCWFNDLRSAYGTFLWGKWMNRPDVVTKSRQTRQLLLHSPQRDGLFPVIYDWDRQRWVGSSGPGVGGGEDIYHPVDCAWAAYWLLMWHRDLEKSPASIAFARRLGDWMVQAQKPSGEIPAYIRMDTMQPTDRLVGGAEPAGCGMFLALLSRTTGEAKYMAAARKVAGYLRREIIPENKWYDYETFYSCSGKPESFFDSVTGQRPQNNLSIHWAAELFRQLYLADGRPADLHDGEALMDYLNLYQQSWAPKFLTFEGFGGYGVQNTDAEWNDARQAQFACTNLDYYRLTGKPEYMERGIAALRAGFATTYMPENAFISPRTYAKEPAGHADENYGHGGVDAPAGPTSWDWGTGSALMSVAYARRAFGDVWVDAGRGIAFGINGVTAEWNKGALNVRSSVQEVAPVLVRGAGNALPASVTVNGVKTAVKPAAWRSGFTVTPAAQKRIRHRAPAVLSADNAAVEFEVWPYGPASVSVSSAGKSVAAKPVPGHPGTWRAVLPAPNQGSRRLPYIIEARQGKAVVRSAYATGIVAFRPEKTLWTDSLAGETLDQRWRIEIPTAGPILEMGGDGLTIAVPGSRAFDQWIPANDAPRVTTTVPESDWSFTARLDTRESPRSGNFQTGLAVELGDNDYAMWGPAGGASVTLERSGHNGLGVSAFSGPMPRAMDLRVRCAGDTLWFDWRPAGGAWSAPVALPSPAPRRAGVFLKTWEPLPARVTIREAHMAVPFE